MSSESSKAIYFISVASTLSGIHPQTIRTYEEKGLIKPYRTSGGTRRYSQEDIDKLIQIQNLSQRGINLDGCNAYITHYPCVQCMKLMCASGIKNVFYIQDYKNEKLVEYFLEKSNMKSIQKV